MSARSLFLIAALLALVGTAWFEAHVVAQQRGNLRAAQKQVADSRLQLARLRQAIDTAQAELGAMERPPATNSAGAQTESAARVAREAETKAWLARTRRLQGLFAARPDQRIPEMQFLTDEDWLRAGKQASFADEHSTRLALGRVRWVAKAMFIRQLQSILRSYQASSGAGEPPASLAAFATLFDPPIDPAILERYEISKSARTKDRVTLNIDERAPVDAHYDSKVYMSMDANGSASYGAHGPPYAWIPDFKDRMIQAFQAYTAAHKGVPPPPELSHIVPYFNPPLDAATVELAERFERERRF